MKLYLRKMPGGTLVADNDETAAFLQKKKVGAVLSGDFTEPRNAGMTLRDYFAAKAVSQIIATCANDTTLGMSKADYFAGSAYEIADAMLKARGQA